MDEHRRKRNRSRSPDRQNRGHQERSSRQRRNDDHMSRALPFSAQQLTKHDLHEYEPLFSLYLDIQKNIDIEELTQDEIKGRWKSFVHKWNCGELANGWYDPNTLRKADEAQVRSSTAKGERLQQSEDKSIQQYMHRDDEDDDDDDFGPSLPSDLQTHKITSEQGSKSGPTIPTLDDIRSRNEDARTSADVAKQRSVENTRLERKLHRKEEKEQLEDLVPQAQAGTRERQLEKRREAAASNRAFAASKDAGGEIDLPDRDIMGGDDLGDLRRMRQEEERRKTEREIRREEILRARAAEREERTKKMKEKEEKTMSMLRELARSRFGDGNVSSATLRED